jgi:hypothetical protein
MRAQEQPRRKFGQVSSAALTPTVELPGSREASVEEDYARQYLKRFNDLELVGERYLPYLENQNVDMMFLLRKKR